MARLKGIEHGTVRGYQREVYRGLDTCDDCREAWRVHSKTLRAKNKKKPLTE